MVLVCGPAWVSRQVCAGFYVLMPKLRIKSGCEVDFELKVGPDSEVRFRVEHSGRVVNCP